MNKTENYLKKWVNENHLNNVELSSNLLCRIGEIFYDLNWKLENETVEPSFEFDSKWYTEFIKKDQTKYISDSCSEQSKCDSNPIFKLNNKNYLFEKIWIATNFGLYYKRMPTGTTMANLNKKSSGPKQSEKYVSILLTANCSNETLRPLIIKDVKEKIKLNNVYIEYNEENVGFFSKKIIVNWFKKRFIENVKMFYSTNGIAKENTILILSKEFESYIDDTDIPEWMEIHFQQNDTLNMTIIEPFIANYIENVLKFFIPFEDQETIEIKWKNFKIKEAFKFIQKTWKQTSDNVRIYWNINKNSFEHHLFSINKKHMETLLRIIKILKESNQKVEIEALFFLIDENVRSYNENSNRSKTKPSSKKCNDAIIGEQNQNTNEKKKQTCNEISNPSIHFSITLNNISCGSEISKNNSYSKKNDPKRLLACNTKQTIIDDFFKKSKSNSISMQNDNMQYNVKSSVQIENHLNVNVSKK